MTAREHSDRRPGPTRTANEPLLTFTCYEADDGSVAQFLVTVRDFRQPVQDGAVTTRIGAIRGAIIDVSRQYGIDVAVAGSPTRVPAGELRRRRG